MTTLAIIGFGISARSLLYSLAKEKKTFSKVLVFHSEAFAPACSTRSTAMVSRRGVSSGVSPLGDLIVEGIETFKKHVEADSPEGVKRVFQYTSDQIKFDQFKKRYPRATEVNHMGPVQLKKSQLVFQDEAFSVEPKIYLDWLLKESATLNLEIHEQFIVEYIPGEKNLLKTNTGEEYLADKVIFCVGSYSRFWSPMSPPTKTIKGSYLEFSDIDWGPESLSLTIDGANLIYRSDLKKMLIGSTTETQFHELPNLVELKQIYHGLQANLEKALPDFQKARIISGLREKAAKRSPYLINHGNTYYWGGLYKNGYILSLKMAKDFSRLLHESV